MSAPKISVIMPTYNSESFLRESIDSILNQTFKDFELIVIDDCSTDSSLKIIKEYKRKDNRIFFLKNDKNLGHNKTRNKGLKIAKGKYIAILDSDDISLEKRLEIQYAYLEKNPHIFLVGSSAIYIDENGKEVRRFRKYDDYKMLAWRLPKSCSIIHSAVMFRNTKEFWYNQKFEYAGDYHLYLDILDAGKNLTNLPPFLLRYRVHPLSVGAKNRRKQAECTHLINRRYKYLSDRISIFNKLKYLPKIFLFYLITFKEKRIKKNKTQWKELFEYK